MKTLVIVESQSKAKTLSKYLGKDFNVLASNGHIRSLPSKKGAVDVENNFQLTWEVVEKAKKNLKVIEGAAKESSRLILATDPDREGEAISWHLMSYLKEKGILKKIQEIQRVTFHAITKKTVMEALENPRSLDQDLIHAYLARLSLDYLVGFTLSPVLWKKLPGSRSAGRVQSVALRLIVDREQAIRDFVSQDFWTIHGDCHTNSGDFQAQLIQFSGEKLEKFTVSSQAQADSMIKDLKGASFHVVSVEKKEVRRSPLAPFMTSTLQQEASRRLGFSPSLTMSTAQKLYEGIEVKGETMGLITYLRTDSVHIETEALNTIRSLITSTWGGNYLSPKKLTYRTKVRNAQEAHEAIRPTDPSLTPEQAKPYLSREQYELYRLIWARTLASQMSEALYHQTTITLGSPDHHKLRVSGRILAFEGFLVLYPREEEEKLNLPPIKEGEAVEIKDWQGEQHTTQPPGRYNDASLVKKLEDLGIGRPSTYAYILHILQERGYVKREKKNFSPSHQGILVALFLKKFFEKYVETDFTARLEESLDEISAGKIPWEEVLQGFWQDFHQTVQSSNSLKISQVLESIEKDVLTVAFPESKDKAIPCPQCGQGTMRLCLGRYGPFLSCSRYPECKTIQNFNDKKAVQGEAIEPQALGNDHETGEAVFIKKGPYGYYFQWGEGKDRVSIPKNIDPEDLSLEDGRLLRRVKKGRGSSYVVGSLNGEDIGLGSGPYGAYLTYQDQKISIRSYPYFWRITQEEASEIVKRHLEEGKGKKAKKTPKKSG